MQQQKAQNNKKSCTNTVEGKKKCLHNHSGEADLEVITGHITVKNGSTMFGCMKTRTFQNGSFFEQNCYTQCLVRQEHCVQFGTQFGTYCWFCCDQIGYSSEKTCVYSHFSTPSNQERLNEQDVLNIKQRMPKRTCLQVHGKELQEVEKHLSPIFVKNRTSSNCVRLKKLFQTEEIIKHWIVTAGEVVNSSSVETFKKQVGKHLSKLTQLILPSGRERSG